MVDKIEVTVTDLEKKHKGKAGFENMYSVAKHVYMDSGEMDTIGFAIDKENLRILGAKIDAMLIDENKKKLTNLKQETTSLTTIIILFYYLIVVKLT